MCIGTVFLNLCILIHFTIVKFAVGSFSLFYFNKNITLFCLDARFSLFYDMSYVLHYNVLYLEVYPYVTYGVTG